jgi:TonB family protein
MSRKIKFHAFQVLFRLFAYLADKSGGWRVFVRPKLLIGSMIVGLGLTVPKPVQAQNQDSSKKTQSDSINHNKYDGVLCYDVKVTTSEDTNTIYDVAEQMPQFPGGEEALMKYITGHIHYPIIAFENGVQGRVICRFAVNRNGEISRVEILRSLDPACDKESIRVIKTLPKFIPAKQNGVNVSVWYTLPVIFNLETAKKQNTSSISKADSVDIIQGVGKFEPTKNDIPQPDDFIDKFEFIDKDGIYKYVEEWPHFPGGDYALMNYIIKNVKYPETKKDIHGTVVVHTEITKTGEIGRVEIFKPLDPALDQETVRVVKSLPKWTPGKHNGENVNVWYIIPVKFMPNQEDLKANNFREHTEIYESVKQMPQFPGGEKELLSYISKNLVYPPSAKQKNIQGDVYVRFVVLDTGKPDKMEVVRSLSPDCDAEAMRIVKSFPNWIPGKLEGKNVNVYYTISVPFKLEK